MSYTPHPQQSSVTLPQTRLPIIRSAADPVKYFAKYGPKWMFAALIATGIFNVAKWLAWSAGPPLSTYGVVYVLKISGALT